MLDVMINSYLLYLIYFIGQYTFYNVLVLDDIHRFTISEVYVASGSHTEQSSLLPTVLDPKCKPHRWNQFNNVYYTIRQKHTKMQSGQSRGISLLANISSRARGSIRGRKA